MRSFRRVGYNADASAPHPTWLKPSIIPLHIVCGAPGSGKSTWVANTKSPADLLIDLDEIAAAISGQEPHAWDRRWLDAALRQRNGLLRRLGAAPCPWPAAWFIVSESNGRWREWWAARLQAAEVVLVWTDKQECLRRVEMRGARQDQQRGAVEGWFRTYSPRAGDRIVPGD